MMTHSYERVFAEEEQIAAVSNILNKVITIWTDISKHIEVIYPEKEFWKIPCEIRGFLLENNQKIYAIIS